jgi:hypothetical protein
MTPKEKAKELVDRFYKKTSEDMPIPTKEQGIDFWLYPMYKEQAKQCALICINEILKGSRLFYIEDYDYWNKLKEEINKL